MATFTEIVETRISRMPEVALIGYQGRSMEDERAMFQLLEEHRHTIATRRHDTPYLVVSGKFPAPLVAVEVSDAAQVPAGMVAFTLPAGDYVTFRFRKEHVGEFWANVCTTDNQAKYKIDLSKPRYEILTAELQDAGVIEWYIPTC